MQRAAGNKHPFLKISTTRKWVNPTILPRPIALLLSHMCMHVRPCQGHDPRRSQLARHRRRAGRKKTEKTGGGMAMAASIMAGQLHASAELYVRTRRWARRARTAPQLVACLGVRGLAAASVPIRGPDHEGRGEEQVAQILAARSWGCMGSLCMWDRPSPSRPPAVSAPPSPQRILGISTSS